MIWALVLAAGASSRMGQPKALLPSGDGRSFVARIADSARGAGADGVLVVLGPPHADVIAAALPADVVRAHNPRPERGMLSSAQVGLAALPATATAALVWPVDVPWVEPATVRALLDAAGERLALPTCERDGRARGGHPLHVPRAAFAALLALPPEASLRDLLARDPAATLRLPVADAAVLIDVDTPADLARRAHAQ